MAIAHSFALILQHLEEIVVVPTGAETLGLYAHLEALLLPQEIERE